MTSANEQNAKYDDQIHSQIKGEDVVSAEIKLIQSLTSQDSKILDIGCGTGRHVIALVKLGYSVAGIDESEEMLKVLNSKVIESQISNLKSTKIINKSFYDHDFLNEKFDLIILMWNSLNELCKYKSDLKRFFEKLKPITKEISKILINVDDVNIIDLPYIDHSLETAHNDLNYKSEWKVITFDKDNNITTSRESINVYKNNELISQTTGLIEQKWWSKKEIESVAKEFGYSIENRKLEVNEELYLVLVKL
jgi:ubiquinone/menaquinone biosynthesis C-methylase UbiE